MSSDDYTDKDKHEDIAVLHGMGYAQELERSMSRFSNFAISFSIICILSGGINSLGQATSGAGGAAIGLGWPLGVALSGVFALALAQISSAYPTAGGLYHWGSILGNRFTGWLSAWLNLLGLVTVLGAINVGTFYFLLGSFGPQIGLEDSLTHRVVFMALITGAQAAINHFGIRLTAKLTDFSGYLILITAAALTLVCLFSAESWDIARLWKFDNFTGTEGAAGVWPVAVGGGMAFLLGLLLPVYTITGYDASAHTAEETVKASVSVPKGMVSSVWWSGLFGWIMLCSFVLMLPNMEDAAKQGWNVFFWGMDSSVNPTVKTVLYVAILVSQLLCGLATVTSASRMLFAFSRDGGIPGASKMLATVSPKHRTPVAAIWAAAVLATLFVWLTSAVTIAGTPAYSIVVSCTVIFLFLSFALPIVLGLFTIGGPKWPTMGPWNIGIGAYKLVAVLSMVAMALIFFLGIQAPNDWALPITVGFIVLALVIWVVFENRRFQGPPIGAEVAKRKAAIAAAEKAVGQKS
ncbi:MAG: amino acid/polyamine transporter protein [Rhodobacteraceae bacterium]|uniref:amino acid permease n=1 Tax=Cypionkella sp. TaxID=2811411 RepID=UPI0013261B01|nr:amino acid permease [Cypionkella sp.]KAF0173888.1 MAG: amino acid/polyamine transporter protein [Paracoccaceae bacterium]MDO8327137.1 amino acid permease [Cypionkella sp.]